jgi:hypothetical protein
MDKPLDCCNVALIRRCALLLGSEAARGSETGGVGDLCAVWTPTQDQCNDVTSNVVRKKAYVNQPGRAERSGSG